MFIICNVYVPNIHARLFSLLRFIWRYQLQQGKWTWSRVDFSQLWRKSYLCWSSFNRVPRRSVLYFFFRVVFVNPCTVTPSLNFPTLYYTNLLTVAKNSKESLLQALELAFLSQCVKFTGVYIISGPFSEDGSLVFSMLTLLLSKCETVGWTTCDVQRLSSMSETLMSPNTT